MVDLEQDEALTEAAEERDALCAYDEPRPPGCRTLTGSDGWRIGIGRVIDEVGAETLVRFYRESVRDHGVY